jgi:hypothetical protein
LSKQDRVSQQSPTIFIPAFEDNKLLDPKITLAFYLRKIEPFRINDGKDELKLFLKDGPTDLVEWPFTEPICF